MVLSETIMYVSLLCVTVFFSAFSLLDFEQKLVLKVIAGLCWFVMALSQFYFFGAGNALGVPFMFLFLGFGMVYCFSIVSDFKQAERDRVYGFMND